MKQRINSYKNKTSSNVGFNYRLWVFIFAFAFGLFFSIPSLFQNTGYSFIENKPKITLGLDLQGGISLLLSVDVDEAIINKYKNIASTINFQIKNNNILINSLKNDTKSVSFNLLDSKSKIKLENMLKDIEGIEINNVGSKYIITLSEAEKELTAKNAFEEVIYTIRNRLDKFGLSEPSVLKHGSDKISVEMPGVKTQADQIRLVKLITQSAKLELMAVDEERVDKVYEMSDNEAESFGDVILPYVDSGSNEKILLKSVPILDGSMLTDAQTTLDHNTNATVVSFSLNSVGAKIFADFSGNNIGKRMAVVLDDKVISAPVIRGRIGGGSGQISGGFTPQSAHDLAIALRSGALLAPVSVIEQRSVGPSLGEDSIRAAFLALVSGFILVLLFMILYYSIAGFFACVALFINLLLIIAIMSIFGATLTLPGMAGIVLIVGIAVDANIIINERIRESLRLGLSVTKAIRIGYENASRAIFDANITSLIASLLLYVYGTGAIKGFALTTGIGILASIITSIIGTYGIYILLGNFIEKSKRINLWFGIKI